MSLPASYRDHFIAQLHNSLSGYTGTDLDEAVKYSELARTKCIGITIETRPDYCLKPHLSSMLRYGCTRLEVSIRNLIPGVQVLKLIYGIPLFLWFDAKMWIRLEFNLYTRMWQEIQIEGIPFVPHASHFKWPKMLASRWCLT